MRLNPTKCAFGVSSGKFLGFMISQRGIEENPEKIKAIIDMGRPKTQKDIQSLTGRVAALTRFIFKATDKCVPFFKALKEGKQHITWTAECDKAFQDLKNYMNKAPLLSKLLPREVLFLYLSVSSTTVSSVLIRRLEKAELRIFYVSKALQNAEIRLHPYFQAHETTILTNQPLWQVLQKPEASSRLIKWAIELGEFDIQFRPRPAEKGQAVADFISELTPSVALELASSNIDAREPGRTSNNEAEYEAFLVGLRLAKSMSAKQISIHSDSHLIVNQITADFAARDASMSAYLSTTHQLLKEFQAYEIRQIPRMKNSYADALAQLAMAINDKVGRKVLVEILSQASMATSEVCTVLYKNTWMSPVYIYLTNGTLPHDKSQARKLRYRSARYVVINDIIYRRGYTTPYLKCITAEQGDYVLREIHGGVCGDHLGSRSLAHKAFRQGYYWSTMR
ncbi:unnamed protein product [Prunus armeniaca]